ncbi:MAG: LPXTG cell wall anchor domain-containing protein, partial [Oscillospiraceae bacterium]|nr:LPXTG cell wall anchor domain-containing protein [Oscillospiraceae bacterium]
ENGQTLTRTYDVNVVDMVIENNAGTLMPETGGIGTKIFYVLGGVLVIGAAVLLITRRRMNYEK